MCKKGQRLIIHASRKSWSCETCATGTYNIEPLTSVCLECPSSATCVNGVPIFDAASVQGEIELDISEQCDREAVRRELGVTLGIEASKIVLVSDPCETEAQRRGQKKISFKVVGERSEVANLRETLVSKGIQMLDEVNV